MSILIRGLEMPTSCEDCPCAYFTEGVHHDFCQAVGYDSEIKRDSGWKLNNCPLVPVPPHGDLIDRDEQIERAWRLKLSTRELIEEMLKSALTIIPAEEGE